MKLSTLHKFSYVELEQLFYATIAEFQKKQFLLDTFNFAKSAHAKQFRDDDKPYIIHPLRAALSLLVVFDINTIDVIQGVLLHDVVEDTKITLDDIRINFGEVVADYIKQTTRERVIDETPQEKAISKNKKFARIRNASYPVRLINVIDLIDNSQDWPNILVDNKSYKKLPRWLGQTIKNSIPLAETIGPQFVRPLQEIYEQLLKKGIKPKYSNFEL